MNISPFLPSHYRGISSEVHAEIDALASDLGLVLRAKSHTPFYGPLDCLRIERSLAPGLSVCFDFKLDAFIQPSRKDDLCARLCERNHHRTKFPAYVYPSDYDNSLLSFDW